MTDYERGVNQASAIYQEAIKDYVAENEKLRDELRKMDQWHSAELTAALDENAKLRELCIDLAEHLLEAERIHGDNLLPDGYKRRMSEIGIEVDA